MKKNLPDQWVRCYVGVGRPWLFLRYVALSGWCILLVFSKREIIQRDPINNNGDE